MMRLEKRVETPAWVGFAVPVFSLVAALVVGGVMLAITGRNPFEVYQRILERGFTGDGAFESALEVSSPLLYTGLAAAVAFRMGVFNIGGDGQFIMGSIFGSGIALMMDGQPNVLTIAAMMVAGLIGGAVWALIPALLRAFASTNEIITSLMLNYVAARIAMYLIFFSQSHWRDLSATGKQFPSPRQIPESAEWLPIPIGDFYVLQGLVIGVVLAVLLFVLYRSTRFGFEVRVVGDSPSAARYSGMSTKRKIITVMLLSGAIAGIGGAANVGDARHGLDAKSLSTSGYGYAGIVIAALARFNPLGVVVVATLLGGLNNAGRSLQGKDFPAGLVGTLQGLILLFALGGELFGRYRLRWGSDTGVSPTAESSGPAAAEVAPA